MKLTFKGVLLTFLSLAGCGGALSQSEVQTTETKVLGIVNAARVKEGLKPLETDVSLKKTATHLAKRAAVGDVSETGENRLPALIKAGCFARFALYHIGKSDNMDGIIHELASREEAKAKVLHGNLTHMGVGIIKHHKKLYAALDLVRLVPKVPKEVAGKILTERIQAARTQNSVEHLEFENNLSHEAQKIADAFMNGKGSSEDLIESAQKTLSGEGFAIGRVTITFQVVSTADGMVVPSITSDPRVLYGGLGFAQGNHPNHEAGSHAIALLLAESQTAHEVERYDGNLPPPKSTHSVRPSKRTPIDKAWIATLSGNHKKAASAFLKAYRRTGTTKLLYEAARAYARDGNSEKAIATMKDYAEKSEGEEKLKAESMVQKLKKGESIFSTSEKKKMSVEAERFFTMGRRLFEQEQWEGAIDAFQQAYAYTKHPDIIYNIGLVHSHAGRIGDALQFFGEYQKSVPEAGNVDEAKQMFEIGVALFRVGQFEAASKNFAMSYAFAPFPHLIYNLALCHKAMGEDDKAARFLREYLDTDPPKKERQEVEKMLRKIGN